MITSPTCLSLESASQSLETVSPFFNQVLLDDENYPKKIRSGNFFKKPNDKIISFADKIVRHFGYWDFVWHFEIFHSANPVGFHNDRNFFSPKQ